MKVSRALLGSLLICLAIGGLLTAQRPGAQAQRQRALLQAARQNINQYKKTQARNIAQKNHLASKIKAKIAKAKAKAAKAHIKQQLRKKKVNAAELKRRAQQHDQYTVFQELMDQYNKKFGATRKLSPKGMRLLRRIVVLYHRLHPRYQELADIYLQQRYKTSLDNLEVTYLRGGSKPSEPVVTPAQEKKELAAATKELGNVTEAIDQAAQQIAGGKVNPQQAEAVADRAMNVVEKVIVAVETTVAPSAKPAIEAQVEQVEAAATKIADTARLVQLLSESDRLQHAPMTGATGGRAYLVRLALNDTLDDYMMDEGADQDLINEASSSVATLSQLIDKVINRLMKGTSPAERAVQAVEESKKLVDDIKQGTTPADQTQQQTEKVVVDLSQAAEPFDTSTKPVDIAIGEAIDKQAADVAAQATETPGAVVPEAVVPIVQDTEKVIKEVEAGQASSQDVQAAQKEINQALEDLKNQQRQAPTAPDAAYVELVTDIVDAKKDELVEAGENAGLIQRKRVPTELAALIDRAHEVLEGKIAEPESASYGRASFLSEMLGNALNTYQADPMAPVGLVSELQIVVPALNAYMKKTRTIERIPVLPPTVAPVVEKVETVVQDIVTGKETPEVQQEAQEISKQLDQALAEEPKDTVVEDRLLEEKGKLEEALESTGVTVVTEPPVKTTQAQVNEDIERAMALLAGTVRQPDSMIVGRATVLVDRLGQALGVPVIAEGVKIKVRQVILPELNALIDRLRKEAPIEESVALPPEIAQDIERAAKAIESIETGTESPADIKEATEVREELVEAIKKQPKTPARAYGNIVDRALEEIGRINEALEDVGVDQPGPDILPQPAAKLIDQAEVVLEQAKTEGSSPEVQQAATQVEEAMKNILSGSPSYVQEVLRKEIQMLEDQRLGTAQLVPFVAGGSSAVITDLLSDVQAAIGKARATGIASTIDAAVVQQLSRLTAALNEYRRDPSVSRDLINRLSKTIAGLTAMRGVQLAPGPVILPS